MQLQKASRFGLYAVALMARDPEALVTAAAVADAYSVSEHHVAKVLQQLARAGIVQSARGPSGGYRLARNPRDLTLFDVVAALEGPVGTTCFACNATDADHADCAVYAECPLRRVMEEVAENVYYTLRSVSVASLARAPGRP
jgi:Rrf2 family protein